VLNYQKITYFQRRRFTAYGKEIFMNLSHNLEDYLEAIFKIIQKNKVARVSEVAEMLNVKKPSVTGALKSLAEKGLVNYNPYKYITLTESGETMARKIANAHAVLKNFFIDVLLLESEKADEIACQLEHIIKGEALARLKNLYTFFEQCQNPHKEEFIRKIREP